MRLNTGDWVALIDITGLVILSTVLTFVKTITLANLGQIICAVVIALIGMIWSVQTHMVQDDIAQSGSYRNIA